MKKTIGKIIINNINRFIKGTDKKKFFSLILFLLIGVIFLLSCKNKIITQVENGYTKYEFIFEDKQVSFIMPEYYSETYIPENIMLDDYRWYDIKHTFYSTKNDYNSVEFVIFENYYDEYSIDTVIPHWVQQSIYNSPPMVPFFEKKKDKNGHIFYLCISSCFDFINKESHLPKEEQNCVYSSFDYITCFNKKIYVYTLKTREPIKDFSYEEKRKIIESVVIEDLK